MEFFKRIWTWLKGLFRSIKVVDKDTWKELMNAAKEKSVDIFDLLDTDHDGVITAGELKDYLKGKFKK